VSGPGGGPDVTYAPYARWGGKTRIQAAETVSRGEDIPQVLRGVEWNLVPLCVAGTRGSPQPLRVTALAHERPEG
jgi:hypothetical protein